MNGRAWSQGDLKKLRELYPSRPTEDVARAMRRSVYGVNGQAAKLGLHKKAERLEKVGFQKGSTAGSEYRFKKGDTPANRGTRRPGWHAGRMKETQFKKGERSGIAAKNWRPIGTIMPDPEGYLRIKVREAVHGKEATGFGNMGVWLRYNHYLWEQHKGPIPAGHIVAFKDKNRSNCVIDNLELLSMADNARRNAMWGRMPPELVGAIMANGALKRKIRRLNGKEQNGGSSEPSLRDARSAEGLRQTDGPGARAGDQRSGADHHQLGES